MTLKQDIDIVLEFYKEQVTAWRKKNLSLKDALIIVESGNQKHLRVKDLYNPYDCKEHIIFWQDCLERKSLVG